MECGKLLGDRLDYLFRIDLAQVEQILKDHEGLKEQMEKQARDSTTLSASHADLAQKVGDLQTTQATDHSKIVRAYNRLREEFRTYTRNVQDAHNRAYSLAQNLSQTFARSRQS